MKARPFTRPTIIAAIELLAGMLSQAKFDQLVVRLCLDDEIPQGPAKSVTAKSALLARFVNQRAEQVLSTLEGSVTLAEAVVREAIRVSVMQYAKAEQERFLRGLALDGYVMSWDEDTRTPLLRAALPGEVDLPATDDEVHKLLKQFGFNVPLGHLDQAIEAHTRGDWAAANSQIRTFLEGLLSDIAAHIDPQEAATLPTSENRRAWLTQRGFLSSNRNEWTSDGKSVSAWQSRLDRSVGDGYSTGIQRCGSSSSILLLGCVGSRVSTSLR